MDLLHIWAASCLIGLVSIWFACRSPDASLKRDYCLFGGLALAFWPIFVIVILCLSPLACIALVLKCLDLTSPIFTACIKAVDDFIRHIRQKTTARKYPKNHRFPLDHRFYE